MRRRRFASPFAVRSPDPGCEAVFESMDRYVEALLLGVDTKCEFVGLVLHLRRCVACHEDTEGLLAAIESLGLLSRTK